jgi:plasmid maintenance system antidote protein VapI
MPVEKNTVETEIVIGKLIKEQFLKSGLSADEFANLIGCSRKNVYSIFLRRSINTDQLEGISVLS